MKILILLALSFVSLKSNAITQADCETASLVITSEGSVKTWSFDSLTTYRKWAMIKNSDTTLLYPKQEVGQSKMGKVFTSDLPKNKLGYELVFMQVSKEESQILTQHLKTCSAKGDCSLPMKLKRCVVAKERIK